MNLEEPCGNHPELMRALREAVDVTTDLEALHSEAQKQCTNGSHDRESAMKSHTAVTERLSRNMAELKQLISVLTSSFEEFTRRAAT